MTGMLRSLLWDNAALKLLAMVLAVFTYLYVHLEDTGDKTINAVTVRVRDLPQDWRVVRLDPRGLDLPITGPRQKIELRNRDNVQVFLPMGDAALDAKEGRFAKEFEVTRDIVQGLDFDINLNFPDGRAPRVEAEIARYVTRRLNVQLVVRGQPAAGFEERWRRFSSTVVEVTGPEHLIRYLDAVPTMPIDITGRRDNLELTAGLDMDSLKGDREADFECESTVAVNIGIKPRPAETRIGGIPVQVLGAADRGWIIRTDPAVIDVTVTGDVDELKRLQPGMIKAYVDAAELPLTPVPGIQIGVKFFFVGEWESIRIKDRPSVRAVITPAP
ncbi:MAG: YbbR-like domain-containing protein [Planctomycetota bacterium]